MGQKSIKALRKTKQDEKNVVFTIFFNMFSSFTFLKNLVSIIETVRRYCPLHFSNTYEIAEKKTIKHLN